MVDTPLAHETLEINRRALARDEAAVRNREDARPAAEITESESNTSAEVTTARDLRPSANDERDPSNAPHTGTGTDDLCRITQETMPNPAHTVMYNGDEEKRYGEITNPEVPITHTGDPECLLRRIRAMESVMMTFFKRLGTTTELM